VNIIQWAITGYGIFLVEFESPVCRKIREVFKDWRDTLDKIFRTS